MNIKLIQNLSCILVSGGFYSQVINLHHLQINENQTALKNIEVINITIETIKDQEQNPVGFCMSHCISLM